MVHLILAVVGSNFMLKIVLITRLKRTWANICNVSDVRSGTEVQQIMLLDKLLPFLYVNDDPPVVSSSTIQ